MDWLGLGNLGEVLRESSSASGAWDETRASYPHLDTLIFN